MFPQFGGVGMQSQNLRQQEAYKTGKYKIVNNKNMYFEKGPCFKRKTCGLGLGQLPGSESQEAFLLSFLRFYAIWHADSETIPEREHVHSVIILSICTCGIKTRERPGNETPD